MMQASAAAPISGIPVLEIVPGDIPVTVLAEPASPPPRKPAPPSLQELLAAERLHADDPPTTKRGPVLHFAHVEAERIFAEEPAELPPHLLRAHRRTFWLAASTITAWLAVLGAAMVWMVTTAVIAQRAETSGAAGRAPHVALPPAPTPAPSPAPTPAPAAAPAPAPAPPLAPPKLASVTLPADTAAVPEEAPLEAAAPIEEQAPPADPALEENPYTD